MQTRCAVGYFFVFMALMGVSTGRAYAADSWVGKGGAQYFVGAWHCAGKVILPGTSFTIQTTAHLRAESHDHKVVDHFRSTGVLGLGASAMGVSEWDPETKILRRHARAGSDVAVEWKNHGGWQNDTLQLEAKRTLWFSMHEVWLLDEFVRSDDDHFEHHTYYAKDSQTWAPFYLAKCERDG